MSFGIDPNTLALSPAQILANEAEKKSLDLAEQRLALEARALTLRSMPSGGGGGTRRVYSQPGRISDPVAAVRASFGESWMAKEKRELAEKTRLAEETQAKRREAFQQRQAQQELAEKYSQSGWEKTPTGWRESPTFKRAQETKRKETEEYDKSLAKSLAQFRLEREYGPKGWEQTPDDKWRERPDIIEARKLETAKKMKELTGGGGGSYGDKFDTWYEQKIGKQSK